MSKLLRNHNQNFKKCKLKGGYYSQAIEAKRSMCERIEIYSRGFWSSLSPSSIIVIIITVVVVIVAIVVIIAAVIPAAAMPATSILLVAAISFFRAIIAFSGIVLIPIAFLFVDGI
jgi:hypothetical protein